MATLEHKDLEIFVITNGRKTFDYVMKSIEDQSVHRKVTVIRDMLWVDALNKCASLSKSKYYIRVDDDMFLHKYTVAYYLSRMKKATHRKAGVFLCKLWEDWSHKPVGGLRMYSTRVARKLKFQPSRLGKVDKVFNHCLRFAGYRQIKDHTIIGIHALSSVEDQQRYRKLWRDHNAKISRKQFSRTFDNIIHPVTKTERRQYILLNRIRKLNKKYGNHRYVNFINKQRAAENAAAEGNNETQEAQI